MIWLVVLAVIGGAAWFLNREIERRRDLDLPYVQGAAMFISAERATLHPSALALLPVLSEAVGDQFRIFGHVRMNRVIGYEPGLEQGRLRRARRRLDQRYFDFVLCHPEDLSLAAVVELDLGQSQLADGEVRDNLGQRICTIVGLPYLRILARREFAVAEVRDLVMDLFPKVDPQQPEAQADSDVVVARSATDTLRPRTETA